VGGEQRLVRGDDIGARRQREQDVGARGLDAAHQLDDDVGADDELLGIRREQLARQIGVARASGSRTAMPTRSRPRRRGRRARRRACAGGGHLGSHGSGAEQGDAQAAVVGHSFSSAGDAADGRDAEVARQQVVDALAAHDHAGRAAPSTATTGGRGT
jgi:hypothetical protein